MILEGLATTTDAAGRVNLAPLGTVWPEAADEPSGDRHADRFVIRPFAGSTTCANLLATRRGVWHVTDDAALIARAVIGETNAEVQALPDREDVRLVDCCRWLAFDVTEAVGPDDRGLYRLTAEVRRRGRVRDGVGLNRAAFALVEGAILATRTFLMPRAELDRRLTDLAPLVQKTGTARDAAVWADLVAEIARRPAADEPSAAKGSAATEHPPVARS
ncbi:DUF447 domain-containing protein [Alienimonas chondri]|uniref:DUF447 family protein n=1 Tax=Alienimonas chondri TaxID=2681879 RepID=A0ABX1V8Q5_9PLAN|nr:DUF447 domain-containing protein [Alienimonas chondri]NNJ24523.1 hypothetical protein [Alienimonas chondri]